MIMYSKVGQVPINLISTNSFFDTSTSFGLNGLEKDFFDRIEFHKYIKWDQ